ncbi:hypothetical protein BESB_046360 [Besnoitia besnoiti]|uniref:Transmembrane protein n=1 Tax=Besnoitia besnoiti TaxID=94643 RepID=A0A2A9MH06_BESBE|nr:hypothetical protein BESB_046360 [Besnoitia besnoiti]PFH36444.1 hypothetical protein BESB_046360 [Besnoitia besnoiti]
MSGCRNTPGAAARLLRGRAVAVLLLALSWHQFRGDQESLVTPCSAVRFFKVLTTVTGALGINDAIRRTARSAVRSTVQKAMEKNASKSLDALKSEVERGRKSRDDDDDDDEDKPTERAPSAVATVANKLLSASGVGSLVGAGAALAAAHTGGIGHMQKKLKEAGLSPLGDIVTEQAKEFMGEGGRNGPQKHSRDDEDDDEESDRGRRKHRHHHDDD